MSAKKDGLSHIGGWLALNDDAVAQRCTENLIMTEGFTTYGGMTGRDMEIISQGLKEVVTDEYLEQRIGQVQYFGKRLVKAGIPIMEPVGGHAIYIDAKEILPHIPSLSYPGEYDVGLSNSINRRSLSNLKDFIKVLQDFEMLFFTALH